ncbi:hypothetical protein [Demequina aestuarii]|uniref:hypothetical protein n=1 Tax=Demequina aestuarii TaxID=327095 RepID=UPI00128E3183|nr:hypothetical protein [Demequina aestuarii]
MLIWAIPAVIVYLAAYLAPVWGLASVYTGRIASAAPDPDPETAIPRSGVFFLIAAGLMLISIVHWLVSGRRRNGLYQTQAALSLVLGPASAFQAMVLARDEDVSGWEQWLIPSLGAAVLGGMFLIAHHILGVAKEPRDGGEGGEPVSVASEQDKRRQQVAKLSVAQQESMRSDLDAAVDDLERRRVIASADANHARRADLGDLTRHMTRSANER